jgi:hypothetical protein
MDKAETTSASEHNTDGPMVELNDGDPAGTAEALDDLVKKTPSLQLLNHIILCRWFLPAEI